MSFRREHIFIAQAALLFVLSLALVVQIGRLFSDVRWVRLDLTGRDTGTLSPQTRAYLKTLSEPLSITYFATPKRALPAHLKSLENEVHALLSAIKAQAPDKIDFRIIDPDLSDQIGQHYAARKRVAPFSVRDILRDEHSERKVWSSLVLAYGDQPEIFIQKIAPEDLPLLEPFILAHLKAQQQPPRPVIAVSANPNFSLSKNFMSQYGEIRDIDLSRSPSIPEDVDVLFWFDPHSADQRHIRALQKFLDSGRTAVLAGSPYGIAYTRAESIRYRAYTTGPAWPALLAPFGIHPVSDLLMDQNNGPVFFADETGAPHQADAPFHLRVMPGFYDLKGFLSPARGALNFAWAGALELDPRKIAETGYQVEILATTTENAYAQPIPQELFTNDDLRDNIKIGKQNLMLRLIPDTPWKGELIVLATASPFRDGIINQPGYGHRVFLQTAMRTLTENTRLLRGRVERPTPPALPELSHRARIFWRIAAVFALPVFFLLIGVHRTSAWASVRGIGGLPLRVGIALAAILIASRIWSDRLLRLCDVTEERIHTPLPFSRAHFSGAPLSADLILPARADLPTPLKHIERSVVNRLDDLGISHTLRRPAHLSPQDRARLNALGLRPFEVRAVRHDTDISEQILSGLLLHHPGKTTPIPRLDDRTADHLEFLLATAAKRLSTGQTPHIAFISETPRLSPAEAYEYHQQGLSPPRGADVFSEAQTLLRDYGYRVSYVDPRSESLPDGIDLIIWMQPRRQAAPMIARVSRHLAAGGAALIALQHYNIQQRQYRGAGFQTVYWPQPQYQDFNQYLTPLGMEQVREILLDRTRARLSLETQINRAAVREYETQEVALPFLIRAVNPNFNAHSPITRHLGDQLFIWGNRFVLNPDSLRTRGLRATPLISTSDRAWAYDWSGGWLPETIFSPDTLLSGHQPLALLAEGAFPIYDPAETPDGRIVGTLRHLPGNPPGKLLLIGSSEMFKNDHLYAPGFQHDQFLLNAIAHLAHGPEYAQWQARRKTARGFAYLPPEQKTLWRTFVLGTGPVLILLYGFIRYQIVKSQR